VRIQNKQDLNRPALIKFLTEGICEISFTKVKDGTTRMMYCTLHPNIIPSKYTITTQKLITETNPPDSDLLPIWDVVEGKWKSFRISKAVYFLTHDELTDENPNGQSTESKDAKNIKNRTKQVMKSFEERVSLLKEKAAQAKLNITGDNNED